MPYCKYLQSEGKKIPLDGGLFKEMVMCDEIKPGLFYRRPDGSTVELSSHEQWIVTLVPGGGVRLQRYIDGKISEAYRDMDDSEGAVAMVGAILGFEPPRGPKRRERLAR